MKAWLCRRSLVIVSDEITMSTRPDAEAAKRALKSIPSISAVVPMRLATSLAMSTSKPSKVPASVLFSHGGLAG